MDKESRVCEVKVVRRSHRLERSQSSAGRPACVLGWRDKAGGEWWVAARVAGRGALENGVRSEAWGEKAGTSEG